MRKDRYWGQILKEIPASPTHPRLSIHSMDEPEQRAGDFSNYSHDIGMINPHLWHCAQLCLFLPDF